MNSVDMILVLKAMIHTFVRFLPLGFYFFTWLAICLYRDMRAAYLLLGLIVNDVLGKLYNDYAKPIVFTTCAIFKKPKTSTDKVGLGFLPNPHTEIVSFVASFFISNMYAHKKPNYSQLWFLIILIFVTIWSRISVGCKNIKQAIFNVMFGAIRGIVYFLLIRNQYKKAEKGVLEKETCDLGYNNYKCSTIEDGVVIVKNKVDVDKQKAEEAKKEDNKQQNGDDPIYNSYYD
jgi:hypothetical protein